MGRVGSGRAAAFRCGRTRRQAQQVTTVWQHRVYWDLSDVYLGRRPTAIYFICDLPDLQVNGPGECAHARPVPATSKAAADAFRITGPLINGRKCFVSFNRIASAASQPTECWENESLGSCLQIKYKRAACKWVDFPQSITSSIEDQRSWWSWRHKGCIPRKGFAHLAHPC